jgi:hypothetical protein
VSEREAYLLRVQGLLVSALKETSNALDSTRLIMPDKETRDMAGNMVRTAREIMAVAVAGAAIEKAEGK